MALGETRLAIDGLVDEAWQKAPALSFDTDHTGKHTGIGTRVRFAWSKQALHALFELDGAGLATDRTRPVAVEREGLYQEDCVEIFLGPDAVRRGERATAERALSKGLFDVHAHHAFARARFAHGLLLARSGVQLRRHGVHARNRCRQRYPERREHRAPARGWAVRLRRWLPR